MAAQASTATDQVQPASSRVTAASAMTVFFFFCAVNDLPTLIQPFVALVAAEPGLGGCDVPPVLIVFDGSDAAGVMTGRFDQGPAGVAEQAARAWRSPRLSRLVPVRPWST